MHQPTVSFIVTTYGRAEGMQKLLDSIRTSTPPGVGEVVIVSSDPPETPKAAWLRQQEPYARVIFADARYPWQLRKRSNYFYINEGIRNTKNQWILPISDDMYVESGWSEEFCSVVEKNPTAGLIIAASHIGSYKHAVQYGMRVNVIGKTKKGDGPWKPLYLSDVSLCRRDIMESIGCFDENMDWFGSGADLSLAVEFLTDTDTIVAEDIKIPHLISKENRGMSMGDEFTDFHYLLRKWDRWCAAHQCQYVWDPGVPPYTLMNRIKNYLKQKKKTFRFYLRRNER